MHSCQHSKWVHEGRDVQVLGLKEVMVVLETGQHGRSTHHLLALGTLRPGVGEDSVVSGDVGGAVKVMEFVQIGGWDPYHVGSVWRIGQ